MKIELTRADDAYHFISSNEDGLTVESDGSPAIGGGNKAMRPMQMVLSAMASCSSIDVVMILKKQRQRLDDIKVTVEGKRAKGQVPAVFTEIHIHFELTGNIKENRAEKAVRLSMEEYCSVSKMLEKTVNITYSHELYFVE
ncbi:MAG: OsmC family protein [Bacteroidota bacterium]